MPRHVAYPLETKTITPAGGGAPTTAAVVADSALRQGSPRLITLIDEAFPLLSTNPSLTLLDRWFDLAAYGIVGGSDLVHINFRVEKPDGAGGWTPCYFGGWPTLPVSILPNPGTTDPLGYASNVKAGAITTDMDTTVDDLADPSSGILPTLGGGQAIGTDVIAGGNALENRWPQLRVCAWADCGSGLYDALGYRLRVRVYVPDLSVYSVEVPIPEVVSGAPFLLREVPLVDLGATLSPTDFAVTACIRRNGATIRRKVPRVAPSTFSATRYDPPAPPIRLWARDMAPGTEWWHTQNGWNEFQQARIYGAANAADPREAGPLSSGSYYTTNIGACSEMMEGRISLAAWREGELLTEYVDVEGNPPVPVPPGSSSGCTLLIKVFRAPWWMRGHYPFGADAGLPRWLPLGASAPDASFLPPERGIWLANGRLQTAAGPVAMLSDVVP